MASFKERKRTGPPMDMEKRGVGGMARISAMKQKGFKPVAGKKDPPPPREEPIPSRPVEPTIRASKSPQTTDADDELLASMGIPPAGVHPKHLQEEAQKKGRAIPPTANDAAKNPSTIRASKSPFAALKKEHESRAQNPPANPGEGKSPEPQQARTTDPQKRVIGPPRRIDYSAQEILREPQEAQVGEDLDSSFDNDIQVPQRKVPKSRTNLGSIVSPNALNRVRRKEQKDEEESIAALLSLTDTVCDGCPISETCEYFEEGSFCAYSDSFGSLTSRRKEDYLPILEGLADTQLVRAKRAILFESRLAGGQLSADVTRQIEIAATAVARVNELKRPPPIPQTTTTVTISEQTTAKPQGLLSQLMSRFLPSPEPQAIVTEGVELNPENTPSVPSPTPESLPNPPQDPETAQKPSE